MIGAAVYCCFSAVSPVFAYSSEEMEMSTPTKGAGTVIENSVKEPKQREFFTIETPEGNIFYLVIDREKEEENVYLLSAVTEKDLMNLTGEEKKKEKVLEEQEIKLPVFNTPITTQTTQEQELKKEEVTQEGGSGGLFFILLVVLIVGGCAYYLKIVKPKKELENAEDLEDLIETEEETEEINEDALFEEEKEEENTMEIKEEWEE